MGCLRGRLSPGACVISAHGPGRAPGGAGEAAGPSEPLASSLSVLPVKAVKRVADGVSGPVEIFGHLVSPSSLEYCPRFGLEQVHVLKGFSHDFSHCILIDIVIKETLLMLAWIELAEAGGLLSSC